MNRYWRKVTRYSLIGALVGVLIVAGLIAFTFGVVWALITFGPFAYLGMVATFAAIIGACVGASLA